MMSFPLQDIYLDTLEKLKSGVRPNLILDQDQLTICTTYFEELNTRVAPVEDYLPLLALLDHSRRSHKALQAPLIKAIQTRKEPQLLIHCLTSSLRVIIGESERKGERLSMDFLNALKVPLEHSDPEVIEWTLRVIEQSGNQSIMLKPNVMKLGKVKWAFFNKHKKNINELIDFLERRWAPAPKPRR